MARRTLKLNALRDICLDREVYRGSVRAKDLVDASWIDFYDPVDNPLGYQRPFDPRHSQKAREYAETNGEAFWPECVLAIRPNDEVDDSNLRVTKRFKAFDGTEGSFGSLSVTYEADFETTLSTGKTVPWRRAFSQVDCQHRLGSMQDSEKLVTFCIFPEMTRREEAILFKAINANQKRITTSLVDAIIMLTEPNPPIHILWARDLGQDSGSSFNGNVWMGGRGSLPPDNLITFRGLHKTLAILAPKRLLADQNPSLWYVFIRNYWTVVASLWKKEFGDRKNYKLQSNPGIRGLAQFGQSIFRKALDTQTTSKKQIRDAFAAGADKIDWSVDGPFKLATGKGGQRNVYEALIDAYGKP